MSGWLVLTTLDSDVEPTRPRSLESVVHSSPIFSGLGMVI